MKKVRSLTNVTFPALRVRALLKSTLALVRCADGCGIAMMRLGCARISGFDRVYIVLESAITLTSCWRYYMIPFSGLEQSGWVQRFEAIDLA
ncbi:hypothetical protein [Sorangium sp. So ce1389]|uniref:hypothetical protein n=1 Tax=Sorangium sp. So ce1389 TaxID=3133336 RepID=UPI003F609AF8